MDQAMRQLESICEWQLESICEMVDALLEAQESGDGDAIDTVLDDIREDPLEISVRSDWHSLDEEGTDTFFRILLCTGGPAVQITGELDMYKSPCNVELQFQDRFTPWKMCVISDEEKEKLLTYCEQFYFGG